MKKSDHFAVIAGNIVEWYDFGLFLYLAPTLAQVFFPTVRLAFAITYVYAIFAAGFIARPIGAVVLGSLGDRLGRVATLKITIVLFSCASLGVAILPSFHRIGIVATLSFILLRLLQGFCIGGEMTNTLTYLAESADQHNRGFVTSLVNQGSNIGIFVASLMVTLLTHFYPHAQQVPYWRELFLLSGMVGLLGLKYRGDIQESHEYAALRETSRDVIIDWREHIPSMVQVCLVLSVSAGGNYILMSYLMTYMSHVLHYPLQQASFITTCAVFMSLFAIPLAGCLSDKIGAVLLLRVACIGYLCLALPGFYLLSHGQVLLGLVPLFLLYYLEQGSVPALISLRFPMLVRNRALALSYNVALTLVGGMAPMVNTWLIAHTGVLFVPGIYLMVCAGLALVGIGRGLVCLDQEFPGFSGSVS